MVSEQGGASALGTTIENSELAADVDRGQSLISWDPFDYASIVAGTWALVPPDTPLSYPEFNSSTAADGDGFTYKIYLTKGTYTFLGCGRRDTPFGIMELLIDAVSAGTIDFYNASTQYEHRGTITGIVVATPGLKTITIKTTGKNASSSAYAARWQHFALWRTA